MVSSRRNGEMEQDEMLSEISRKKNTIILSVRTWSERDSIKVL